MESSPFGEPPFSYGFSVKINPINISGLDCFDIDVPKRSVGTPHNKVNGLLRADQSRFIGNGPNPRIFEERSRDTELIMRLVYLTQMANPTSNSAPIGRFKAIHQALTTTQTTTSSPW